MIATETTGVGYLIPLRVLWVICHWGCGFFYGSSIWYFGYIISFGDVLALFSYIIRIIITYIGPSKTFYRFVNKIDYSGTSLGI